MRGLINGLSCLIALAMVCAPAEGGTLQDGLERADHLAQNDDAFPESSRQALALYEQAAAMGPRDPRPWIRAARVCLALGDANVDNALAWYERGERAADRALVLKEDSADAHFYLAANRGNAVNLKPFWKVSPGILAELEQHLARALALDSRHAPALHMMGMLLDRAPGALRMLLVGKKEHVEDYLTRAATAGPNYAYIQWSLAQFYVEKGRSAEAQAQARKVVAMRTPIDHRRWAAEFRPAAVALLKKLSR